MNLIGAINGDLIRTLGGASAGASSGSGDLSQALNTLAQAFERSFQRMDEASVVFGKAEEKLSKLLEITGKLIELADRSASGSTRPEEREALQPKFRKLIDEFKGVLADAKEDGIDLLSKSDLARVLRLSGVDTGATTRLAEAFKKISRFDDTLGHSLVGGEDAAVFEETVTSAPGGGDSGTDQFTYGNYSVVPTVTAADAYMVAAGDADGDGNSDLYIASADTNFGYAYGAGDGTFGPASSIVSLPTLPGALLTGDFQSVAGGGAAGVDEIAMFVAGNVVVLDPAANFLGSEVNTGTLLIAGDVNGDGITDLIGHNPAGSNVLIYELDESGAIVNGHTAEVNSGSSSAKTFAAVDVNEDGNLDILMPEPTGLATVALGNGDFTFEAPTLVDFDVVGLNNLVAGDFNGDGHIDVAGDSYMSSDLAMALGNGDGTFQAFTKYSGIQAATNANTALKAEDINGDGRTDIIQLTSSSIDGLGEIGIFLGQEDGTLASPQRYVVGPDVTGFAIADFNKDGIGDFAVASIGGEGGVRVLLSEAGGGEDGGGEPVVSITADIARAPADPLATTVATRASGIVAKGSLERLRDDIKRDLKAVSQIQDELEAAVNFAISGFNAAQTVPLRGVSSADQLAGLLSYAIRTGSADSRLAEHSGLDKQLVSSLVGTA